MTSHPKDLSDDVIMAIKECDKLCPTSSLTSSKWIIKNIKRDE